MFRRLLLIGLMMTAAPPASLATATLAPANAADDLPKLVERIAKGDDADAADATEELIEATVAPLAGAIGSLEKRPTAEIIRLRGALAQLSAALRLKLARVDLPPADRELFDSFIKAYPELSRRLFHDRYTDREEALQQIPLDANTGAGVMLALRVDDEEESVAFTALKLAKKLKDPVVARGLARYVRNVVAAVDAGQYGPADGDLQMTLGLLVLGAMDVLAETRDPAAIPDVLAAFRCFSKSAPNRWMAGSVASAAQRLGRMADERAAATLAILFDDPRVAESRSPAAGTMIVQTVGDAAMLGVLDIYSLKPDVLGMSKVGDPAIWGFADDGTRQAARRQLRIWIELNAAKPAAERAAFTPLAASKPAAVPATQPVETPRVP